MPLLPSLLTLLALCAAAAQAVDAAVPRPGAPVVMLKLDDLTKITPRWKRVADFIAAEGLKVNFGVINSPLEQDDPALTAWVKELTLKGTIEVWNHGYDAKYVHDKEHKGEFEGSGYEVQLKNLQRAQELAKLRFGTEYAAFGPHWSGCDADTFKALDQIPGIQVIWFYGPKAPATTTKVVIERRMELEKPLFQPNPEAVKERFEAIGRNSDYLALQGHADQWDDQRFANFQQAVRYLKDQGCRFVTVSEWLASRKK